MQHVTEVRVWMSGWGAGGRPMWLDFVRGNGYTFSRAGATAATVRRLKAWCNRHRVRPTMHWYGWRLARPTGRAA